ncbi:alkaline phosphatase PafA [Mucilaginibacter sp. FT3.2]|uniref:alkaline phosphatase PafA n=1 Tax=Mucilaginibacter sp. FT3.2 TaxID=2723090 RepID=UPI001611B1F2|nr:alkaline phosphatase PafA [Mucilaginibacter sp. FT3.2]MBB6230794.1 putative AlkP superfamily pyrophosphatase or phosphodiesterase [Mucilaginibacter sp. FT3.2]
MKLKHLLFLLLAAATFSASAQSHKKKHTHSRHREATHASHSRRELAYDRPMPTGLPRPKLVIGLVVDQMRWDYLYRYFDRYEEGGFKRMLGEGFTCENTNIDYIPTVTAAGHTCIYTGSVPAIHGIAGNDFIVQATGKSMYCTDDSTVTGVGSTSKAGQMSPRNLLVTTVTDELRLATNFRSKVIGIALKDRGGILPAGHTANAAYWFDDASGNWISSTYYMNSLPAWVKNFNDQKIPEKYLKQDWNTLYPVATYLQSAPDNSAKYEGKFPGADAPTMPVKTSELYKGHLGMIRSTPFGNSMTLDIAKAAIQNEQLGKNTVTDFLAVSLSSTDYIGHQFGPNSVEIEDTYLRLDHDLATFFTYLDETLGKGNYSVFLTADHGAAHNPNFLKDHNIPAGTWDDAAAQKEMNAMLSDKYKVDNLVISMDNYQVNLNNIAIKKAGISADAIKLDCISYLQKQPAVQFAVDMQNANAVTIPVDLRSRIVNGYNAEHSGVIQVVLKPGYFSGHGATGTTHGTWAPYDTHIPLVFMGWGINHGSTTRQTHMTDIAATVASLLHIQAPDGCIGKTINDAIR